MSNSLDAPAESTLAHSHPGADYVRGCPRCDKDEIARMNRNTENLIALARKLPSNRTARE
jgi:hypothetical protein